MDKDNSGKNPGGGQKRKRRDPVLSNETNLDLTPYVPRRAAVQAASRLAAPSRPLFSSDNIHKNRLKAAKPPRTTSKDASRVSAANKKRAARSRSVSPAAKRPTTTSQEDVKSNTRKGNPPGLSATHTYSPPSPPFGRRFRALFQLPPLKASDSEDETIKAPDIEDETIKPSESDDETIEASDIDDETIEASDIEGETLKAYDIEEETIEMSDSEAEMIEAAHILMSLRYGPEYERNRPQGPRRIRTAITSDNSRGYHASRGPPPNDTANSFSPGKDGGPRDPWHHINEQIMDRLMVPLAPTHSRPEGPPAPTYSRPKEQTAAQRARYQEILRAGTRFTPTQLTQLTQELNLTAIDVMMLPPPLNEVAFVTNETRRDQVQLPIHERTSRAQMPPQRTWQDSSPVWEPASGAVRDALGHYLEYELFGTGKPATKKIWTVIKYPEADSFNILTDGEKHPNIGRDYPQEDAFYNRPSIRFTLPDHLKNLLVDDWENVTKSMLLVPLPSSAPANYIFDEYFNAEKKNRMIGSAEADILEEFVAGLKIYFEKTIGKLLLYRFERPQLAEVCCMHIFRWL